MSTSKMPKQFLDVLGNGETLLQQTFRRLSKICPPSQILVVTNTDYKDVCVDQLPEIKKDEILRPPRPARKEAKKVKRVTRHVKPVEKKEEKKFETVIKEEKDDARKAAYISYYRAVREKIKRYADRNYLRNRRLGEGEVFLSFVVASSGELLHVKVASERSVDDPLLRNIGINSIRDASPFSSFPKGMSQYQITFNVIIAFEHR